MALTVILKFALDHHFGIRLFHGFDSHLQEPTKKTIIIDEIAMAKITKMWKQWEQKQEEISF